MNDISIKKAAFINFVSKYAGIFIQILYQAILARILTPNDFGIVAVIAVFTTFFMVFADMGLGTAVIQNKRLTREDTNNIFSFTVYFGIGLAIVFCLFSIPLAYFYNDEVYKSIGCLLSISLFFNTLNMIPNAVLLKEKKFVAVGLRLVIVSIISAVFTIILAIGGFKYYAIVFYSIFTAFFTFLWNEISVKARFSFKFKWSSLKKVFNYSAFQFAFNIINYFSRNLDNLLIGKFMGNDALAYYDKGYRLMLYPVQNLTHVITPVLHPILSEYQNDKNYIYIQYMKIVKVFSLMGIFISIYCYFAAGEIVLIMFGSQWESAVPCFKFLALSVWSQMVTSSSGAIFQSLGDTRLLFCSGFITAMISVIAILIGVSSKNILNIAICVTIAYNIHFIITYIIMMKWGFKDSYTKFLKMFFPELIIALLMILMMHCATQFIFNSSIISAIYKAIIAGIVWMISLLLTRQMKYFTAIFKPKQRR